MHSLRPGRLRWRVLAVNDDGRERQINEGMCQLAAEKVAGAGGQRKRQIGNQGQ